MASTATLCRLFASREWRKIAGEMPAFKDGRATYVATLVEAATKLPTCLRRRLQPQKSFSMGNLRVLTKNFDSCSYLEEGGFGLRVQGGSRRSRPRYGQARRRQR
ncbi:hypothetical protein QYE76_043344 [Lolium multiflorum]|uniref:Uncharacterized protein n=1 Tax=Lolium multiflorum TaxID=4521 RepID=A0AAD8TIY5_LOLMU|nr:hypothetical protein QYE76_043344 [Lolium multiflorum]